MSVKYIDQYSHGLRYYLTKGIYDVTSLEIIKERTVSVGDLIDFRFGILGASHFLHVTPKKEEAFSEVFACSDIKNNEENGIIDSCVTHANFYDNDVTFNKFSYEFKSDLRKFSSLIPRVRFNKLNSDRFFDKSENTQYLGFEFPSDESNLPSLTLMKFFHSIKDENIFIDMQTMHCYQKEEVFVETNTRINYAF